MEPTRPIKIRIGNEMRGCGECTVCCYLGAVPELNKPGHRLCKYQSTTSFNPGCTIYDKSTKPKVCSEFQCAWLRDWGQDEDRPDKNGVVATINKMNGGTWIFINEMEENALLNGGKGIVLQMVSKIDLPAIVVDYDSKPPDDKGNRVVIKEELLPRTDRIRGEYIDHIDDGMGLYKLVVS